MEDFIIREVKRKSFIPPVEKEPEDYRVHLKGVNGTDGMSSYNLPSSNIRYKNITDVMNKKPFSASYPQSYTPVAGYFRKFGIAPFFSPGADSDYAYGSLTIAGMVELTENKQPWQLARDQDIGLILHIAKEYLDSLRGAMNNPTVANYARKVDRFIQVMESGYTRMRLRKGETTLGSDFVSVLKRLLGRR